MNCITIKFENYFYHSYQTMACPNKAQVSDVQSNVFSIVFFVVFCLILTTIITIASFTKL